MRLTTAIEKFLGSRRRRGCNAATVARYRKELGALQRALAAQKNSRLEKISTIHLENYFSEMRERPRLRGGGKVSPVTIRKLVLTTHTFFKWCRKERLRRGNPAARLPIPRKKSGERKMKALTPPQISQLLTVALWTQDVNVARDYALILLMLDSGLRLAEITALDVGDIDLDRGLVHVRHGKGDNERWSVFLDVTANALREWLRWRALHDADALWTDRAGERLSALAIYRGVKRRAVQTGLGDVVSPHRLRHTFATEYLNAGGNIYDLQARMGHEDIQTTLGYRSVALVPARAEHVRYSPLRNLQNAR